MLDKFETFLKSINLSTYREKYRPIKIVEMDLPKKIQAISMLYKVYWTDKDFVDFDNFYNKYLSSLKEEIESFRKKTTMCKDCFYRGLPARIYRTWASIITQIHAGYVAESVFGKGSVEMSEELDHQGADFVVAYKDQKINYQVKKKTESREVRKEKKSKKKLTGKYVIIEYKVPDGKVFDNPKTKKGEWRKPYLDFIKNKNLKRFDNGFVVFTPKIFVEEK